MLSSTRRRSRVLVGIAAGVTFTGSALVGGLPAHAATSTVMTVTAITPKIVASASANQVITLTGTGFDESAITDIAIDKCTTDPNYIVVSATTLALKTAGTDCGPGAAVITITDSDNNTVVTTNAGNQVLTFAAPPTIATISSSVRPVLNENTVGLAYADQVASSAIEGGTTIRVLAGGTIFANSSALPLKATLGGVAMTDIKMAQDGSYFTAKTPKHAAGAVGLQITSAGVAKSFTSAETGYTYAGTAISLTPSSGAAAGGTVVTITGAGFVPSGNGASTVTFGTGNGAPTGTIDSAKSTTTKLVVTAPALPAGSSEGPVSVVVATGSVSSVINAGSTFTYTAR